MPDQNWHVTYTDTDGAFCEITTPDVTIDADGAHINQSDGVAGAYVLWTSDIVIDCTRCSLEPERRSEDGVWYLYHDCPALQSSGGGVVRGGGIGGGDMGM